jgi:hypothetical protein
VTQENWFLRSFVMSGSEIYVDEINASRFNFYERVAFLRLGPRKIFIP